MRSMTLAAVPKLSMVASVSGVAAVEFERERLGFGGRGAAEEEAKSWGMVDCWDGSAGTGTGDGCFLFLLWELGDGRSRSRSGTFCIYGGGGGGGRG